MKRKRKKKHPFRLALIVVLALLLLGTALYFLLGPKIDRALYPREYQTYVERYAKQYDVPANLIYAVIRTESDFDSEAVSSVGAVGLMQMMPSTFRWLSDDMLGEHLEDGMLYDPETNIRYGVYCLSYLYNEFGLWHTVYAAYNAGPNRVRDWTADSRYADENGALTSIPFEETRAYAAKVEEAAALYQKLYG